jgi:hypothetical protein
VTVVVIPMTGSHWMTKMIENIVLWDTMTMAYLRYHFEPHLAVKHLETNKYLFLRGRPLF